MGLFSNNCRHKWEINRQHFTPARQELTKANGWISHEVNKLIFGYTTYVLVCSVCGDVESKELIGDCRTKSD